MESIDTIYLDMDGVASNFVDAVGSMYGYTGLTDNWESIAIANGVDSNTFDIAEVLRVSSREMWNSIESVENFWLKLKEYKYFMDFYEQLRSCTEVPIIFLTSPSLDPDCARQKIAWLQQRFGRDFRDWILCPAEHKRLLARSGKLLIDDSDKNYIDWTASGGVGIIFPRHWNKAHSVFTDPEAPYIHVIKLTKTLPLYWPSNSVHI